MKQAKNDWLDCIQCEAAEVKVFRHRQQWSSGQVNRRAAIIINNIGGRLSVCLSGSEDLCQPQLPVRIRMPVIIRLDFAAGKCRRRQF